MGTNIEWTNIKPNGNRHRMDDWRQRMASGGGGPVHQPVCFLRGAGHEFQTLLLISEAFHPYLNEVLIGKHR